MDKQKIYDIRRRTYVYALEIIKFLDALPKDFICQTISRQLLRSATSIGANIVEAQSASSKKDFANFYNHSLKSANESKFWLGILMDSGRANPNHVNPVLDETCELASILASSILTIKGKR